MKLLFIILCPYNSRTDLKQNNDIEAQPFRLGITVILYSSQISGAQMQSGPRVVRSVMISLVWEGFQALNWHLAAVQPESISMSPKTYLCW